VNFPRSGRKLLDIAARRIHGEPGKPAPILLSLALASTLAEPGPGDDTEGR